MEEKSETVTTPPEINLPPGAVDKTSVSKNTNAVSRNINTCSKNITSNKKSSNKRRRKRSYRKNARIGNKFNKNRDVLLYQQRAQRRQLFFSDMTPGLVPYNTNSFLMAEHYPKTSPKFNYNRSLNVRDSHDSSSRSMSGSGMEEDEDFLSKEFRLDYENLRLEQLQGLSKEAVIQEILKLENQMESSLREKEVEIQTLNNKIRELTRRLKHKMNENDPNNQMEASNDSGSSDSDSSSDSSSSSSTSSSSEDMNKEYPELPDEIAIEPPAQVTETVSC